jgi:hypothetical protein
MYCLFFNIPDEELAQAGWKKVEDYLYCKDEPDEETEERKDTKTTSLDDFKALGDTKGRFFRAPRGIPGVRRNTKLYVESSATTPPGFKLGGGLPAHFLSHGVMVVQTKNNGFAFLKS